mgnify:CR=1 FL=1
MIQVKLPVEYSYYRQMNFVNNQVYAVSAISQNSSPVLFNNGKAFSFDDNPVQSSATSSDALANKSNLSGDLSQNFGYIEIPLEIKYNFLSTKKINTQIVAGFSSLILNKNQIRFDTPFILQSGKANNLNNINFSGNLGLDFNYILNNNWSLNLNPMFKAQLNTFSENSNGFAPFNIGIYSGVRYNF